MQVFQQNKRNKKRRQRQRRAGRGSPKRRGVRLGVARGRVGKRIERKGERPPGGAEGPAEQVARVDQESRQQKNPGKVKIFQKKYLLEKSNAVRVDQRRRHQQDEPARAQRLGQRRGLERADDQ